MAIIQEKKWCASVELVLLLFIACLRTASALLWSSKHTINIVLKTCVSASFIQTNPLLRVSLKWVQLLPNRHFFSCDHPHLRELHSELILRSFNEQWKTCSVAQCLIFYSVMSNSGTMRLFVHNLKDCLLILSRVNAPWLTAASCPLLKYSFQPQTHSMKQAQSHKLWKDLDVILKT